METHLEITEGERSGKTVSIPVRVKISLRNFTPRNKKTGENAWESRHRLSSAFVLAECALRLLKSN
jgi:hypothetical protein